MVSHADRRAEFIGNVEIDAGVAGRIGISKERHLYRGCSKPKSIQSVLSAGVPIQINKNIDLIIPDKINKFRISPTRNRGEGMRLLPQLCCPSVILV